MVPINKVLLLFAHPSQHRSEINRPMFTAAQAIEGITCVDLYADYPTLKIDVEKEQTRLLEHDVVIFQFPFYWYSTPAIFKEWQDLVLEHGFAYGNEGKALHGKLFLCALSAGGGEQAYRADGINHFTLRELLHPLEQTANLTGMKFLAPFAIFGSRDAVEEDRLAQHLDQWCLLLRELVAGRIDIAKATERERINSDLDSLILNHSDHQPSDQ